MRRVFLVLTLAGCGASLSVEAVQVRPQPSGELSAPIDGILSIELHAMTTPAEPSAWHAIRWSDEHHGYVAQRHGSDRNAQVFRSDIDALLELLEQHRETFTLPVTTSDFVFVHAAHIAIERAESPPQQPANQEAVDQLNSLSDQWALLGDIARSMERETRRAATFHGVRQSMEDVRSVCAQPTSNRCHNHQSWVAAYEEISTRLREIVDAALAGSHGLR